MDNLIAQFSLLIAHLRFNESPPRISHFSEVAGEKPLKSWPCLSQITLKPKTQSYASLNSTIESRMLRASLTTLGFSPAAQRKEMAP